ncbi:Uncharacterised protein [Mycobacteroides abscessus subsp. abscessus]|nr:Uncharacterised protein [Mycobacteroides abscessus subsp. abscessus]
MPNKKSLGSGAFGGLRKSSKKASADRAAGPDVSIASAPANSSYV